MLPLLNSPLNLEGLTTLKPSALPVSMENLSENEGFMSLLADSQESLSNVMEMVGEQFSDEQLQMLKQFMEQGKSLPQAAEMVVSSVMAENPAAVSEDLLEELETLQNLAQQLLPQIPVNTLPADAGKAVEVLPEETLPVDVLPQAVPVEDQTSSLDDPATLEAYSVVAPLATDTEKPVQPIEESVDETLANTDAAHTSASIINQLNQAPKEQSQPVADGNLPNVEKQAAAQSQVQATRPVATQPNSPYQTKSIEQVVAESVMPEAKPVMNNLAARVTAILQDTHATQNAINTVNTTGSGSASTGGQAGGNTSFTQLLSQAIPQPLTQNIHKPEWGGAVSDRVAWMIGSKLQSAELQISPAHLGPVKIKLALQNDQAQLAFASQHQVVRDALENSIPRLREMMDEQNIDLVDVDISDQQLGNEQLQEENGGQSASAGLAADESFSDSQSEQQSTVVRHSSALLDTYA